MFGNFSCLLTDYTFSSLVHFCNQLMVCCLLLCSSLPHCSIPVDCYFLVWNSSQAIKMCLCVCISGFPFSFPDGPSIKGISNINQTEAMLFVLLHSADLLPTTCPTFHSIQNITLTHFLWQF